MNLIDNFLLDEVSRQAQSNPRLRMNHNFHDSMQSPSQRLLNALEPGTVIFECKDGPYTALEEKDVLV